MTNKLAPIALQKQHEVTALRHMIAAHPEHAIAKILRGDLKRHPNKSFKKALKQSKLAVIAEIKRKSPSKGALATIADPISLAQSYITGGANALSILTDEQFFAGNLHDLTQVAHKLRDHQHPILRKDFIIDEIQIAEAIAAGADAILCIVALVGNRTQTLLDHARKMGIEVLVEIHNRDELKIALSSGAEIIGVNNRDLATLKVNTDRALQLISDIPKNIVAVAESGITEPVLARQYYQAGFNAVLIGEALVTATQPENFIKACHV